MKRPKRKAIPRSVRLEVNDRQLYCCAECKQPFTLEGKIEHDHRPPLEQREVSAEGTDYIPPQLDPDYIDGLHEPCHLKRTTGRAPGATTTVTTKGSDSWRAAKFRRLEGRNKPKRKTKIPQRKNPWGTQKRGMRR